MVVLKAAPAKADRRLVGQRPVSKLPQPEPEPEAADTEEPKLELVADPAALDAPVDEDEQEEAKEKFAAGPTQDPLKLYVRQIGDGPLLTQPRSASSPGARTRVTRRPRRS